MTNTVELPAGTLGVDYSFERPDPHLLAAAGVRFVCRYLAGAARNGATSKKVITADERDLLWHAGLTLLLNWEQSSGDFLAPAKGASQGSIAASEADALGYPASLPIIVSCDEPVPASAAAPTEEYFANFRSAAGGYRLGVYGEATIANALISSGLVDFVWAPDATGWSRGVAFTRVDLTQHVNPNSRWPALNRFGATIDIDVAQASITTWAPQGFPSASPAAPTAPLAPRASSTPTASSVPGHPGGPVAPATPTAGRTYTVRAGDSWWHIAETQLGHGRLASELASFNGRSLQSVIHPGDVLHLPHV